MNIEDAFTDDVVVALATTMDEREDAELSDTIGNLVERYTGIEPDAPVVQPTDARELVYRAFMAGLAYKREDEETITVDLNMHQARVLLSMLLSN